MKRTVAFFMIFLLLSFGYVFAKECDVHDLESYQYPPTCTEKGYTLHTCIICGYEYTDEMIPETGHEPVYSSIILPTCEKPGISEASHCNICGEIFSDYKDIPALGHDWKISSGKDYGLSFADYECIVCQKHIRKDSAEYIYFETERLLKGKKMDLSYDNIVMSLYESFVGLYEAEKNIVSNKDILIDAADVFILYHKGDIDLNGKIDTTDLSILLSDYGTSSASDINSDRIINWEDLSILLSNYGLFIGG